MTTFDLAEVRVFAADLNTRMQRCDNGEGMECATLEADLRFYANLCCEFSGQIRQWGRAVFYGCVEFDSEVERVLKEEGRRLRSRAMESLDRGQKAECYILDEHDRLQSALWDLDRLLKNWVTPKPAVGPSARQVHANLDPAVVEEGRRRIESLPPLPADWQPDDPRQQAMYRKLRNS
jgi:hypothetical protein